MSDKIIFRNIRLKDLWDLFIQRFIIIMLAALITGGSFFVYDRVNYVPQYASTATLYIMGQSDDNASVGEVSTDFSLALRLVNDCTYLLKSRKVLGIVIDELDLKMGYYELNSRVSTSNPTNTRILEITVRGNTPEQAKAIVDKVCAVGSEKIREAMGVNKVNLYEYGTVPFGPCNAPNLLMYGVIGMAVGAVVYAVFLLLYLLDDSIRTEEDIQKELGLSILAEIPDLNDSSKNRYGYYQGYGQPRGTRKPAKKPAETMKERS